MLKQSDKDIQTVIRHKQAKGSVRYGLSLLQIGEMIVSPMEGAHLWRRLRAEVGPDQVTLSLFNGNHVGFRFGPTLILWQGVGQYGMALSSQADVDTRRNPRSAPDPTDRAIEKMGLRRGNH